MTQPHPLDGPVYTGLKLPDTCPQVQAHRPRPARHGAGPLGVQHRALPDQAGGRGSAGQLAWEIE